VEDLRPNETRWQIRLHEKGGKEHKMPCHLALSEMLHAYVAAAGIADDRKGRLFLTSPGHNATVLTEQATNQSGAWFMFRRRAVAAGHHRADRQPYLSCDRHHEFYGERQHARTRAGHVRARKLPHD
jgi:hypothetical protein